MKRFFKAIITIFVLLSFMALCQSSAFAGAEDKYQSAKKHLKSFEKSKKNKSRRDLWVRQIDNFEGIVKKYPNHKRACDSLYNIGMLYKGMSEISLVKSDRRQAAESFEKLAARCGSTSLGDDGLYWAAVMYVRLHDEKRAIIVAKRLIKRFENGDMRAKAEELLKELKADKSETVAEDEIVVADKNTSVKAEEKKAAASEVDIENSKLIAPAADNAELTAISHKIEKDITSVTLMFSRLTAMTSGEIPESKTKPRRIYFDFADAVISDNVKHEYPINGEFVDIVRVAPFSSSIIRVVFELTKQAGRFTLENTVSPATTTVKIRKKADTLPATLTKNKTDETPTKSVDAIIAEKLDQKSEKKSLDDSRKNSSKQNAAVSDVFSVRTIVVDPGHGGEDQGARGPKGTLEKDIVLAIAKKLQKHLEKHGFKVVLTRTNDHTMTLFERTEIANDLNADIFVSIHCNGNRKSKFKGVETFYLNNSSDTYSTRLAKRENESMGQQVSDLDFILTDLSMNANVSDSIALANFVQKSMVKDLRRKYKGIEDRGVRRAVFHVLLYARMPAILVETSFITNPQEEQRLKNSKYQEQLSKGIAIGIKQYAARLKKLKKN